MVGLQYANTAFIEQIINNSSHIYEVYFSWGDFSNGRSSAVFDERFLPWELQARQIEVLKQLSESGIKLNILFNANCYGGESQARTLFNKIGYTVDYIISKTRKYCKNEFRVENMEYNREKTITSVRMVKN